VIAGPVTSVLQLTFQSCNKGVLLAVDVFKNAYNLIEVFVIEIEEISYPFFARAAVIPSISVVLVAFKIENVIFVPDGVVVLA